MKYVFLINSFTVGKKIEDLCSKIKKYCENNNIDYVIEINDINNSTDDILNKYKDNSDIILAVGGDGMINRVLNNIVNTKNVLGFIPSGTGNDFYRSVNKQFDNGINDCDLIRINNKYFINTACFGIDADIANGSTIIGSKIFKKYKYIINLIKNFYKYNSREFCVEVNGKKIKDKFVIIVLSNGMYYGSGFNIGPKSLLNNGYVDVYFVKEVNKIKMLQLILSMRNGKHEKYKEVEKYIVKDLIIKSKQNVKSNIDGEILEAKKFEVKVLNKKIKIYYNQEMINSILK